MSKDKCCGNCKYFKNTDEYGYGVCEKENRMFPSRENKGCDLHSISGDWAEITPDNENEITDLAVVTDGKEYKMVNHWHLGIGTMAKVGGYYYYLIPELRIDDGTEQI